MLAFYYSKCSWKNYGPGISESIQIVATTCSSKYNSSHLKLHVVATFQIQQPSDAEQQYATWEKKWVRKLAVKRVKAKVFRYWN